MQREEDGQRWKAFGKLNAANSPKYLQSKTWAALKKSGHTGTDRKEKTLNSTRPQTHSITSDFDFYDQICRLLLFGETNVKTEQG